MSNRELSGVRFTFTKKQTAIGPLGVFCLFPDFLPYAIDFNTFYAIVKRFSPYL